ncbi:hypothetical protein N658DRAFT_555251 [Parathielavia hyrcaniae]|uniref:CrcB-like protein n=1 Tax=Parathielavia hyrcaniae TaxID=113614 RepID=A0AAN6T705_9PEZI|nr:hypothetical protein N658DRAFT_555251 [Parathielavia hyrcaniae]
MTVSERLGPTWHDTLAADPQGGDKLRAVEAGATDGIDRIRITWVTRVTLHHGMTATMEQSSHMQEVASRGAEHDHHGSSTGYNTQTLRRHVDDPINPRAPQHALNLPFEHPRYPSNPRRQSTASRADYDIPDTYANLDETLDVSPVQNPHEERFRSLEQVRSQEQETARERNPERRKSRSKGHPLDKKTEKRKYDISRFTTQLYTVSYLILFSILGTLARLGLQALTTYPGTPIIFTSIWPNFAGSLVMGFLSEDRMLFQDAQDRQPEQPPPPSTDEEHGSAPAKQAHTALKKAIPLYIGLATGFCGSLTSFSSFVRDMFLALSNDFPASSNPTNSSTTTPHPPRNGGHSFLALLSVPIVTVPLSLSALFLGAHCAIALARLTPRMVALPRRWRSALDRLAVLLGWGCWLGAMLLSVLPPRGHDDWRGKAVFALVFAPLGCLARFYLSLALNGRVAAFPLGTFAANLTGTAVLALAWDLAHSAGVGGRAPVAGCQVLAGVQDGFCGCLTTVSTWVGELAALRRRHAYVYGGASVLGGLAVVVAVMGGLRWSGEYERAACG